MGASATQDDDIIIFNDESESEQLEIVNDQGSQPTESKEVSETKVIETEDLISFATDDEVNSEKENLVEDSLIDLVSEDTVDNILAESPSIEEQLKGLEISEEAHIEKVEEKIIEDIQEETIITSTDENLQTENDEIIEDISLEIESHEDFKNQLIEAQDQKDGVSFEDMGIDLDKLWDSEGENLKNITHEEEVIPENSLEAETAVFGGIALLWLEKEEEEESIEIESNELTNDISAFSDLTDGIQDVDEGTHDGILEAAILKLVNRNKAINGEIKKEEEIKSGKKDEISGLKWQIKVLQWEVNNIDSKIKELETEKATTIKTKEGLEKMKIAA